MVEEPVYKTYALEARIVAQPARYKQAYVLNTAVCLSRKGDSGGVKGASTGW